jgi:hypothetical protein
MIAMSWATVISIWALVLGSLITSWHLYKLGNRILKLERRVFELEMRQTYPKWER